VDNNQEIVRRANRRRKRCRKLRKLLLLKLIKQVLDGKLDAVPANLNNLYNDEGAGARRQYMSPQDRSSYDYGYMKIPEMQAGPTSW